jgi:putative transposase
MIDRDHRLPVSRQCRILGLSRSTAYYQPVPVSSEELALMRWIDELHLKIPSAGSRTLRTFLRKDGHRLGRQRIRRLMRKMGLEAIYRKPNLSRRHASQRIYPYLLRHLNIDRPNHVWATDITYIPMRRGFVYLVAIMDWYSRRVLAWRLSNTLSTDFCVEALEEAIARYGAPEIFNTDQGSQFTSTEFTDVLKTHTIRISMDGKGCWRDNVFVERLWRTVKYEEVYLKAYDTISAARASLGTFFDYYNRRRPHQSLDDETPDAIYFAGLPEKGRVA